MTSDEYSEFERRFKEIAELKALLDEKKGIWVMDNGYSSDRVFLCKEIAESLKQRGHWVPRDPSSGDLIIAIAKALDTDDFEKSMLAAARDPKVFHKCLECDNVLLEEGVLCVACNKENE